MSGSMLMGTRQQSGGRSTRCVFGATGAVSPCTCRRRRGRRSARTSQYRSLCRNSLTQTLLTTKAAVITRRTMDPASQYPQAGELLHCPPSPVHTTSMSQWHRPCNELLMLDVFLHRMVRTRLTTEGARRHSDDEYRRKACRRTCFDRGLYHQPKWGAVAVIITETTLHARQSAVHEPSTRPMTCRSR